MDEIYAPEVVEPEVQTLWDEASAFHVDEDPSREKFYCLAMFPYPRGQLHMGHVRTYVLGDVTARLQRLLGKSVLYSTELDSFGLPNELAAIAAG